MKKSKGGTAGGVPGEGEARCTAIAKRSGTQCKKRPIIGATVCLKHGGAAPQVRAAAERRVVEAAAAKLARKVWDADAAPITNHVAAIQALAGQMRNALDTLGEMINTDDAGGKPAGKAPSDLDSVTATAWIRVMRELRQLLADMGRMGIAERAVEVEAARVRLMSASLARALDELDLTQIQRERAVSLFIAELRTSVVVDPVEITTSGG